VLIVLIVVCGKVGEYMNSTIPINQCTFYGFTDPAGKKHGTSAMQQARQAIVVIAVSPLLHIFVPFAWADKLPTTAYIRKLLQVHEQFKPKQFGIEANAMQSLFADVVRDTAKKELTKVTFMPVFQPTNIDKNFRIRTIMEPVINYGRLFVDSVLVELISELSGFPTAQRKDMVDCLASAIRLVPKRAEVVTNNEELANLAKYLRDTGAPAWYINQRMEEERKKFEQAAMDKSNLDIGRRIIH